MKNKTARFSLHLSIIIAALLIVGRVDFLPDWVYLRNVQASVRDKPFDILFSLEKVLFLPVVLFCVQELYGIRIRKSVASTAVIAAVLGAAVLVGPALAVHFVAFEPKLPGFTPAWMLQNLFFVCILEELIYRNYLFEGLSKKFGVASGAFLSSMIFGSIHFRGGMALVVLAAMAGLIYVFAYRRGGLVAAVLAHFGVNLLHFLFFSYPALLPMHHRG